MRRRPHALAGRIFAGALGEDTTLTPTPPAPQPDYMPVLTRLDERTAAIMKQLDEDNKNRRYALMIGAASALFAAVKLGIIAFPHIRARVGGGQ